MSANPGVTCKFTLPAISLTNPQPALNSIMLSGPTVSPIALEVDRSQCTSYPFT
jgi:hypothetical protein